MDEWVTANESLNSMQMNLSEDPQSGVKQEPNFGHGDSSATNSSSSPLSSSVYYSARTESMMENKRKFQSELEFNIEYSKAHWSHLADTDDDEDTEHSPEADLDHFERLKAHHGWGEFFRDFDSLVVGEKIGEGAQAEIYAATLCDHYKCVVKVFKEGYALRDLQRQWPEGMLKWYNQMYDPETSMFTTLQFYDPRNGYFKCPRNAQDPMKDKSGPLECIHGGTLWKDERFNNRFAFVMKRQWGDLRRVIDEQMLEEKDHGPPFSTATAERLMASIARGMRNLHQTYGIIHRDLKASNVLIHCSPRETGFGSGITVADFECSLGVVGTAFWRAPEILQQLKNGIPSSKIRFSFEADIYSYGMTCYEIVTGRIPFEELAVQDYDAILNGERPELPHDLAPSLRTLIIDCWHPDPSRRPFFCDIVDFFTQHSSIAIAMPLPSLYYGRVI